MSKFNVTQLAARIADAALYAQTAARMAAIVAKEVPGMGRNTVLAVDREVVRIIGEHYGCEIIKAAKNGQLSGLTLDGVHKNAARMALSRARAMFDPKKIEAKEAFKATMKAMTPAQRAVAPLMAAIGKASNDELPALRTALMTALAALEKAAKAAK